MENFDLGDLVWAKMKGFSYWPARIVDAGSYDTMKVKTKAGHHCVFFFGSQNVAWIPNELIEFHSDSMMERCPKKKTAALQKAIDEIVTLAKTKPHRNVQERVVATVAPSPEIETNLKKKRRLDGSPKLSHRKAEQVIKNVSIRKSAKKRKTGVNKEESREDAMLKSFRDFGILHSPLSVEDETSSSDNDTFHGPPIPIAAAAVPEDAIYVSFRSSFSPPREGGRIPRQKVYSPPSGRKIGFIGLGMMGKGIVKHLMLSRHKVTVWDKTPEHCDRFVKRGAIKADTVAELVKASEIIFCCVADSAAVKSLIFSQTGVLTGLEGCMPGEKGYVEMTTIEPDTSVEICEAITRRGGKYLEAPVVGSGREAYDGDVLTLTAGDISLFEICEPVFLAISRHSHYISCKVGVGAQYAAVLNAMMGSFFGAMAETLTFVERMKMGQKKFLDIIKHTGFGHETLVDKACEMVKNEIVTDMPLNQQQESLEIAIVLSEDQQQPLNLSQAAAELYKHSCLVGFAEKDVATLFNSLK